MARLLLPLIRLSHLKVSSKRRYRRIFDLYTTFPIDYVDCYNAALVIAHKTAPEILSYDTDFDLIRDDEGNKPLTRMEPSLPAAEPEAA